MFLLVVIRVRQKRRVLFDFGVMNLLDGPVDFVKRYKDPFKSTKRPLFHPSSLFFSYEEIETSDDEESGFVE